MNLLQADIQLAIAKQLRWMPDAIELSDEAISLTGWALTVWDSQARMRFLVNGEDFDEVEWPLPSPDLPLVFPDVPAVQASRFRAYRRHAATPSLFPEGFARFNVTGPFGEHRLSYRSAWFMADPAREAAMPSLAQIERVIGTANDRWFRIGGATIVQRFDALLQERFSRPLASFEAVLDWGCGAGRLSRYLAPRVRSLTGIDIDGDNIAACSRLLPQGRFLSVGLLPPTPLPAASFDLVLGLSVLTHLEEAVQDAWLRELQRLTRPGALLLLSVEGLVQTALYRVPPDHIQRVHERGIVDAGANAQLEAVLPGSTYYRNTWHSPDYILAHWSRWFDVLDIIGGVAGNQDLVLLRRRADAAAEN